MSLSLLGERVPSTARGGRRRNFSSRATNGSPGGEDKHRQPSKDADPAATFSATEGNGSSRPANLFKENHGEGPFGDRTRVSLGNLGWESLRHRMVFVANDLVGIELNPGPGSTRRGRRGRGDVARGERNGRRYERRRGRRVERNARQRQVNGRPEKNVKLIVTWNGNRVSMREENRIRLRDICDRIEKEGWEIVLLTEVLAQGNGVVWLGEGDNRVAVVHSEKAAVVLRGKSLEKWVEEGQQKWFSERVVTVVVGGMRLISMYQPIWGTDAVGMERCRREIELQLGIGRREKVIIEGDFNASVGRTRGRRGVYGKQGIGAMNEAGRDLMEWCGMNGLAYVNSFMIHERRGTWQHPRSGRWYELDGFLTRKDERHGMVVSMRTMKDSDLSDHRAKGMKVKVIGRKWRTEGGRKRPPRIKWEALRCEEKKIEYKERTRQLMEEEEFDEGNWENMTKVMLTAAKEVCGETTKPVANPWTIGFEDEIETLKSNISRAVRDREAARIVANEERQRGGDRPGRRLAERRLEEAKERVRVCRRRMKRRMKDMEKEWWQDKIDRCEEACAQGRVGEMYEILRELGMRGKKRAGRGGALRANDFKTQFESVSKDRYEEEPGVLENAVGGAKDLRENEEAIEANRRMNEIPGREEVMKAMKDMRESAPGEDGVRIGYIKNACDEMKEAVIELVRKMFASRASEWSEVLKSAVIVPLFKKGDREDPGNYRGICLIGMGSRILARVIAKRLGWWAEHLNLLDENQAGFRKSRSTADVTQMMVRIEEDVSDMRRRVNAGGVDMNENEWPVARLLDLRKAYPRVNKPALWGLLERYGLKGHCMNAIMDLHETTEYKVRAQDGMSGTWMPARGLREGCSTSPILFNVYHQAVMRQVEEARNARGSKGIVWNGCLEARSRAGEYGNEGVPKPLVLRSRLLSSQMTLTR